MTSFERGWQASARFSAAKKKMRGEPRILNISNIKSSLLHPIVEASSCLLPEELAAEACIPGWDCRIRDENPISELIDHDLASGTTAANNTAT